MNLKQQEYSGFTHDPKLFAICKLTCTQYLANKAIDFALQSDCENSENCSSMLQNCFLSSGGFPLLNINGRKMLNLVLGKGTRLEEADLNESGVTA